MHEEHENEKKLGIHVQSTLDGPVLEWDVIECGQVRLKTAFFTVFQ
jgi:hypothetical protein